MRNDVSMHVIGQKIQYLKYGVKVPTEDSLILYICLRAFSQLNTR